MKLLAALAFGALALGVVAPAQAQTTERVTVTRTEGHRGMHANRGHVTKKVVIRRDNGMHRGWAHSRHRGATVVRKKVIVTR